MAQLGARFHGMEEVESSNLSRSTTTFQRLSDERRLPQHGLESNRSPNLDAARLPFGSSVAEPEDEESPPQFPISSEMWKETRLAGGARQEEGIRTAGENSDASDGSDAATHFEGFACRRTCRT